MNVFVFPSSNEPGLEIIRALAKSNKITLFGGSSYSTEYDPARHLLKNFVECPGHTDPDFQERFVEILRTCAIDVVFPAWDRVIAKFASWKVPGVTFITPAADTALLLLSKRATYERLQGVVNVPRLYTPETAPFPVFAKPDDSSGSRDTLEVRTGRDLDLAVERGLLLCEYLPGEEYTVDCVSGLDGQLLYANARARKRIGRGIALGARDTRDPELLGQVDRVAEALHIAGPWFAQFKRNAEGTPVLMEVNARVAGSMGLTRLAGVNIPLISVFLFTGNPVRIPKSRSGLCVNRSLGMHCEHEPFNAVVWDWDDTLIRKDGKPDPDAIACLYDLRNRGVRQWLLTRNPDIATAMDQNQIPQFFESVTCATDKVAALSGLFCDGTIDPAMCVMVNDSYAERFLLEESFPSLRIITPDALDYLGREPVS